MLSKRLKDTIGLLIISAALLFAATSAWSMDPRDINMFWGGGLPKTGLSFLVLVDDALVTSVGDADIVYQSGDETTWATTAVWGFERTSTTIALDTSLGGGVLFSGVTPIYKTWASWMDTGAINLDYLWIGQNGVAGYSVSQENNFAKIAKYLEPSGYYTYDTNKGATLGDEIVSQPLDLLGVGFGSLGATILSGSSYSISAEDGRIFNPTFFVVNKKYRVTATADGPFKVRDGESGASFLVGSGTFDFLCANVYQLQLSATATASTVSNVTLSVKEIIPLWIGDTFPYGLPFTL